MLSDILEDIKVFLQERLSRENLSSEVEKERKRLVDTLRLCLNRRESSPYLDMTNTKNLKDNRVIIKTNEYYEEFPSNNYQSNSIIDDNTDSSNDYYQYPDPKPLESPNSISNKERLSVPSFDINSLSSSSDSSKRNSSSSLPNNGINNKIDIDSDKTDGCSLSQTNNLYGFKTVLSNSSSDVYNASPSALRYSTRKHGLLCQKQKRFLFEVVKQYWVGLKGSVLLVYANEKANKPIMDISIKGYQARRKENTKVSKKEANNNVFEIICPGKKTYEFIAPSTLEMDDWIDRICFVGKMSEESDMVESCDKTIPKVNDEINEVNSLYVLDPLVIKVEESNTNRQLPLIPKTGPTADLTYDVPDSIIRPVTPSSIKDYVTMDVNNEDDMMYHYIAPKKQPKENDHEQHKIISEIIYANDGEDFNENGYYNCVSNQNIEQEDFYSVIGEANDCNGKSPTHYPVDRINSNDYYNEVNNYSEQYYDQPTSCALNANLHHNIEINELSNQEEQTSCEQAAIEPISIKGTKLNELNINEKDNNSVLTDHVKVNIKERIYQMEKQTKMTNNKSFF